MIEEWRRLRDFGLKIHQERANLAQDGRRLSESLERARSNHARAATYLNELAQAIAHLQEQIPHLDGVARRQAEIRLQDIRNAQQNHGLKRKLFHLAIARIYGILLLNRIFSELLADMASQIHLALRTSLDLMRYDAREETPPAYLVGELRQALGRLQHPERVYQRIVNESKESVRIRPPIRPEGQA